MPSWMMQVCTCWAFSDLLSAASYIESVQESSFIQVFMIFRTKLNLSVAGNKYYTKFNVIRVICNTRDLSTDEVY